MLVLGHSKRSPVALALAVLAAALLALAVGGAGRAAAADCPSFEVLHNDRIGAANLPAGTYSVTSEDSGLSCAEASRLFARFLEDWDGNLPRPWRVVARGTGRAAFTRANQGGFSVARIGGREEEAGGNPLVGRLCPSTFTVNAGARVGPLFFTRGRYLLYRPAGSAISCNRAAVLFTRFLSQGRQLAFPWKVKAQTATFYRSPNPIRSAFRVEPFAGS